METAIIFKCYDRNDLTLELADKLRSDVSGIADFYIVFDSTGKLPMENALNISQEDYIHSGFPLPSEKHLAEMPNVPKNSPLMFYNPEYQAIFFWHRHKEYKYYWTIESDVWFNGNWQNFFEAFAGNDCDLLGAYTWLLRPNRARGFFSGYWQTYNFQCSDALKQGTFGAVLRYSNKLLHTLEKSYLDGFHGFYETIVPTLANINGLQVGDINNDERAFYHQATFCGYQNEYWIDILDNFPNYMFHPVKKTISKKVNDGIR